MTIHPREFLPAASNHDELVALLVARRRSLGLTQVDMDALTGLADGLVSKIECGIKRIGATSLECLLGALKVRLALVPAAASHADFTDDGQGVIRVIKDHHATIAKKGGKVRMARMTARQRRLFARKAATARWSKVRAAEQAEKAERQAKREAMRQARLRLRENGAVKSSDGRAQFTPVTNSSPS
jgi:hypothetical protein